MRNRIFSLLIILLLATAITACEPPSESDNEANSEIATAVEQIATAMEIESDEILQTITPVTIDTPVGLPELVSPTPANALNPTATPTEDNTPFAVSTEIATLPPTSLEIFTPSPEAIRTDTPAVPETGILPSPTLEQTPQGPLVISPATVEGVPPEIELSEDAWPLAHHDYNNSRAAINSEITAENVSTLGIAWSFDVQGIDTIYAPAGSPIISSDNIYYQDLQSNVYAFNLRNGSLIWRQDFNQPVLGLNGPAIGYGKLFVHVGSNSLRALDLSTGEEIWNIPLEGSGGSHQPIVYGGLVFTSTHQVDPQFDSDEQPQSGWFYAIQQETGEIAWQRPAVQEDLVSDIDEKPQGGAWFSPAIDPVRGLSFWGTGKIVALPGMNELSTLTELETGNPFSRSVAALRLDSGELVWSSELDPSSAFGHGLEAPPLLVTIEREDNVPQDLVIGAGRSGTVMALDRDTGEQVWKIQVGRQQNNTLITIPPGRTIQIYPGVYGGIASPLAFSDGTLYAAVNQLPADFSMTDSTDDQTPETLQETPTPTVTEVPTDPLLGGSSELYAIDGATGAVLWSVELPYMNFGGVTLINDILFTTTIDGAIYAFDLENGDELWAAQAPEGLLSLPAVAGDTIVLAALGSESPFLFALRLGLSATATPTPGLPTATPTLTPTLSATQPPLPPTLLPTITPSPELIITPTETEGPEIIPTLSPDPTETETES